MKETPPQSEQDVIIVEQPQRSGLAMTTKRVVQLGFTVLVLPRLLWYRLNQLVWGRDRAFLWASESISQLTGMHGVYMRQAFYRLTLARCGQDVSFGWQSTFSLPAAEVGDGCYIGRRCSLGHTRVEPHVMLADGVQVLSGDNEHGVATSGDEHQDKPQVYTRVTLGRGAWIGTNAIIMADVGEGAIVGAGAVVTKPVPPRTIAAGVPAKAIGVLD